MDVRTRLFGAAFVGSVQSMTGVAVATAIIIGALYFGRELFVPIALAILLSFVGAAALASSARAFGRQRCPPPFLSIFALGGVIAAQVAQLAGDLP